MKFLTLVVVVMSAGVLASGQSKDPSGKPNSTDQSILRIEQEMLQGTLKGDVSANERHLADTYVFTGPDGMVQDKAQVLADIKSGDLKLESATLDDPKVRVYGDTAVVTYGSKDKGTYKGKDISGNTRWTDVFVRRSGRWQVVASHGSSVTAH